MAGENPYFAYYEAQMGSGALPYYHSRFTVQGGRGWIGNLFRGAWSYLRPLLGTAGAEAVRTGTNIVRDVMANPSEPIKEIAKRRGREGLSNLAHRAGDSLSGRGVRVRRKRLAQKQLGRRGRRNAAVTAPQYRRNLVPAIRDLFSPPSP